jgi:hypothetical protein
MLIVDEPEARIAANPESKFAGNETAPRKIIDFETARKALEETRYFQKPVEQSKRTALPTLLQPSFGELLELLVTIALSLIVAISFLFAAIQGL